jgi:transposase-like protein
LSNRKDLVAVTDGHRESTESYADLLRDCRRRGMTAPVLVVGYGALGFWDVVREVFPRTREQRCWFHKQANVLAALPKSAHPAALGAIKEIYNAEDIGKAQLAIKAFEGDYRAKHPKAVAKIVDDLDTFLEFFKYPAEHWIHLRTSYARLASGVEVQLQAGCVGPSLACENEARDDLVLLKCVVLVHPRFAAGD